MISAYSGEIVLQYCRNRVVRNRRNNPASLRFKMEAPHPLGTNYARTPEGA